jgi:xanthine dehydrogenase molybdopterin-binding subunit B
VRRSDPRDDDQHGQGAEHSATAASSGADLNGAAVAAACVTLRERLLPVAAGLLGTTPEPGDLW